MIPVNLNKLRSASPARVYDAALPDDLTDLVWLRFSADSLSDGPVSSWADRAGGVSATQSNAAKRPTKAGMGVTFIADNALTLPFQQYAHYAHRALVLVFRIDIASSSQSDGSLLYINGSSTSNGNRQPLIGYNKASSRITVEWRDGTGGNVLSFDVSSDPSLWHCLVTRRVGGIHYASIDGTDEQSTGSGICCSKHPASPTGLLGDFRATAGFTFSIHELILLQDELSLANAQRLAGWGMWKVGAQDRLPSNHPYRNAPPTKSPAFSCPAFAESTGTQWQSLVDYINSALFNINRPAPPNLTGYSLVFEDHFEAMTVVSETSAPAAGNWFCPVHPDAVGAATEGLIGGNPNIWSQSGSELAITMQQSSGKWYGGVFSSVNLNGHGRTWNKGYFEFRAKVSNGNGKGCWPAFWVKSVNEFFRLTESRLEIDLYEGYNSDPTRHHATIHNWPAARLKPGRITANRHKSNISTLITANGYAANVNLFDDAYHTYGLMIDADYVYYFFDNQEVGRFPTPIEAMQDVYIIVDLALLPTEASQAVGPYTMTLDYIRVYQKP